MALGFLKRLAIWRKKKKTEPVSVLIKGRSLDDVGLARNCTGAIVDCNPPAYQACGTQCPGLV